METFSGVASVSGEWQVTASVTNESSVQLHLFAVLLWRANHSSLFVKLFATPQERREREGEEIKHLQETSQAESKAVCH